MTDRWHPRDIAPEVRVERDRRAAHQLTFVILGIGGVLALVLFLAFLTSNGQGWIARVVVHDAESTCIVARQGSNPPEGAAERCYRRGSEEVKPEWSELQVGTCVSMLLMDDGRLLIDGLSEPNSC